MLYEQQLKSNQAIFQNNSNIINNKNQKQQQMSVYGGFPTKKLQQCYNVLIQQILVLMANALSKLILKRTHNCSSEEIDRIYFQTNFDYLYKNMKQIEMHKYLSPKFSLSLIRLHNLHQQLSSQNFIKQNNNQILNNQLSNSNESHFQQNIIYSNQQNSTRSTQNQNQYLPVTNIYCLNTSNNLINNTLNIIGEDLSELDQQIPVSTNQRIKSGGSIKSKYKHSNDKNRPYTSIRRKQLKVQKTLAQDKCKTIDYDVYTYISGSKNNSLARSQKQILNEGILLPKKKLYEQLEKTLKHSAGNYENYYFNKIHKRRSNSTGYKIAKLF